MIPLLIILFVYGKRHKESLIEEFVSQALKERVLDGISATRQKYKIILILTGILFSVFALIRPKWGFHWEKVTRRGVDIIVALDVSKSMLAEDVSPNRLERAQRELLDLLNIIQGDRVGLLAFAGTSFLQTPLTLDYGAVKIFLDDLDTELIPIQGTAIANAIDKAVASFDVKNKKSRVLILITDGEDHLGKPIEAARRAASHGIRIYTIGIGDQEGVPIPNKFDGGFIKDSSGQIVLTHLDEEALQKIALETKGRYVRSTSGDLDLEEIYKDINNNVEDRELKSGRRKRFEERFQWPLFLGFCLLFIELFVSERKKKSFLSLLIFIIILIPSNELFASIFNRRLDEAEKSYRKKEYGKALENFLDVQLEDSSDLKIQYNLASTYYQMKDYEKALKLFLKTSMEGEENLVQRSFYNLGNTYYKMGKLEASVESYEKALEREPNDEDTKFNLKFVRDEIKRRIEENKKREEERKKKEEKDKEGSKEEKEEKDKGQKKDEQESNKEEEGKGDKEETDKEKEGGKEQKQQAEQERQEEKQAPQPDKTQDKEFDGMSEAEAMRWLNSLTDERKKYLKKNLKSQRSYQVEKNW